MERGKPTTYYISIENLSKLDSLRGGVSKSDEVNRILTYILSQSDSWVQDLIGAKRVM